LTRNQFDRKQADNQDNALDIMQRAGIDLLWKENDGGDKEVAHRSKKIEVDESNKNALCNGQTCYDMALLSDFDQEVSNMNGNRV
ncbi:phosphoethanolamine transferase, partial [Vibrio parahaemolyticus]|nr:phosphoethanolamine transferase [Vibrio parahaemolyticus]